MVIVVVAVALEINVVVGTEKATAAGTLRAGDRTKTDNKEEAVRKEKRRLEAKDVQYMKQRRAKRHQLPGAWVGKNDTMLEAHFCVGALLLFMTHLTHHMIRQLNW